ncbi:MAG: hypothetical protein ABIN58_10850, partial [candidate division WOR-3 bacterium]
VDEAGCLHFMRTCLIHLFCLRTDSCLFFLFLLLRRTTILSRIMSWRAEVLRLFRYVHMGG